MTWSPCTAEGKPLDEEMAFVESEKDILGKPWSGQIRIRSVDFCGVMGMQCAD